MLALLRSYGLPVRVLRHLGRMSFREHVRRPPVSSAGAPDINHRLPRPRLRRAQVVAMAGTGILVAGHGAALVNSIFLPQVFSLAVLRRR